MEIYIEYENNEFINLDKLYTEIINFIDSGEVVSKKEVKINDKNFTLNIQLRGCNIILWFKNLNKIEIKYPPLEVKFPNQNSHYIFKYYQLMEYLKYYKIDSNNAYLYNIKNYEINEDSFNSIMVYSVEIKMKENLLNIFNEVSNLKKYSPNIENIIQIEIKNLSKYFSEYIKENVKQNDKFSFILKGKRSKFLCKLNNILMKRNEVFITGLHGIGKSISLISLKYFSLLNINKFSYYNLDVLSSQNNWKQIIIYETSFIFDDYVKFNEIINDVTIKNPVNYLDMIYYVIYFLKFKNYLNGICFIIDQFDTNQASNKFILENIRNLFIGNLGAKLIVCSTINDETVRGDILRQFGIKKPIIDNNNFYELSKYNYIYLDEIISIKTNNKELSKEITIFNNLPIYEKKFRNSNDFNKIENEIFSQIEIDLKNYWKKNNINDYIYAINSIQKNIEKILDYDDFMNIEKYFSFKYFCVYQIKMENIQELSQKFELNFKESDYSKFIFKYSFIYLEFIIKTMKKKEYNRLLSSLGIDFFNKSSEKGNVFEYTVEIFFIENISKCIFGGAFEKIDKNVAIYNPFNILRKTKDNKYINYYEKTIEIVSNDNNKVIFFTFDDDSAKNYDFLILIKKIKTAIAIQATIHKDVNTIMEKYKPKNIKKDYKNISKQFKDIYNLEIEHFYLYFIINPDYTSKIDMENIYYENGLNFFIFMPFEIKYKFKEFNIKERTFENIEIINFELSSTQDYGEENKREGINFIFIK